MRRKATGDVSDYLVPSAKKNKRALEVDDDAEDDAPKKKHKKKKSHHSDDDE
jgi:hypothetical protein